MTGLSEKIGSFETKDRLKLFYRSFPASPQKGRMVIAHGVGEHSGRYMNVVEKMHPLGISTWALDHRGHGQSSGPKGHVNSFQEYIENLATFIKLVKAEADDGKFFLLGHSMGGLIAANYALKYPETIDGLIISSPALGMKVKVPVIKEVLGKLMSSIYPGLTLGNELDVTKISHDPEVIEAYEDDALVHNRVSARWFTEFLSAMEVANRSANTLKVPILMQLAGDDHLVDAPSSQEFFKNLAVEDRTLHVYDGLYHEIYNEMKEDREKVLSDLVTWLTDRY